MPGGISFRWKWVSWNDDFLCTKKMSLDATRNVSGVSGSNAPTSGRVRSCFRGSSNLLAGGPAILAAKHVVESARPARLPPLYSLIATVAVSAVPAPDLRAGCNKLERIISFVG
jgi:hypothetical protein